jgi:hypothetical protein
LTAYCPDPSTLTPEQLLTAYDKSHYIWYYFSAIGFTAAIALMIYKKVVDRKTVIIS